MPKFENADAGKMNESLRQAALSVMDAVGHLENAQEFVADYGDRGTLNHFAKELDEFLLSDGGEAGFARYLKNIGVSVGLV